MDMDLDHQQIYYDDQDILEDNKFNVKSAIIYEDQTEEPRATSSQYGAKAKSAKNGLETYLSVDRTLQRKVLKSSSGYICEVCGKTFVSLKGLQQHAVVHTDQKPFVCKQCGKSFRFKSNLFEHRSLHTEASSSIHQCPYCNKSCRLKGNLKKHLRTHVATKEELDRAWLPFSSNRRHSSNSAKQDSSNDASSSNQSSFFTPNSRTRKRKSGLGKDAKLWINKIRSGEFMPSVLFEEKMSRLLKMKSEADEGKRSIDDLLVQARAIPFERFDCPICKCGFMSRMECSDHLECDHALIIGQIPYSCETCLRNFPDKKSYQIHISHHEMLNNLVMDGKITLTDPEIVLPCDDDEMEVGTNN